MVVTRWNTTYANENGLMSGIEQYDVKLSLGWCKKN